jgi:PAS domain S-box-containing protein
MEINSSIGNEGPSSTDAPNDARSLFGKISSRIGSQAPVGSRNIKPAEALLLLQNYEESQQGWFWSTDALGNLTYLTESIAEVLGGKSADLLGKPMVSLFLKPVESDAGSRTLPFILTKKMTFNSLELRAFNSVEECWLSISGRPCHDKLGNFQGFRGSGNDVTAQRRLSLDTSRLAMFDSLTGLANRASMAKKLETTLAAYQVQKRTCAVMLVDLDRFKQINDTLGHPAGDALLKQVAERLLKVVGSGGEVCRLGAMNFR